MNTGTQRSCDSGLTLQFVLGTSALQQREVTHDVLELHRVQRPGRRGHLQRGRVAFDQLQPCRETQMKGQNILHRASYVSSETPWDRMPDISHTVPSISGVGGVQIGNMWLKIDLWYLWHGSLQQPCSKGQDNTLYPCKCIYVRLTHSKSVVSHSET